jgi:hypothetical protein
MSKELPLLSTIKDAIPITALSQPQRRELQHALLVLGYPVGEIDGLHGPRTATAWSEYKHDVYQGHPDMIGPGSVSLLKTRLPDQREHNFGTKEGTISAIIFECRRQGLVYPNQIAYVLATTEWETNKTFQPVIEAYWLPDEWRRTHLRYFPYYGRGYVQLTWRENYRKYGEILGIPLEQKPDLALDPSVALFVLVHGLKTGTFTGRKISDYIDHSRVDYFRARRCVNGMDKAAEIAGLARDWAKRII